MARSKARAFSVVLGLFLFTSLGRTCSVVKLTTNLELVSGADAVVRAKAVEYFTPPVDPKLVTNGMPDSRVRFKVLEVIRGANTSEVVLPGNLVETNDFNDQQAPYTFVRPGGRSGSCFANSYRQGAEYLLFLKRTKTGELSANWAALAPVNEQLHSADDPWLLWTRQKAQQLQRAAK